MQLGSSAARVPTRPNRVWHGHAKLLLVLGGIWFLFLCWYTSSINIRGASTPLIAVPLIDKAPLDQVLPQVARSLTKQEEDKIFLDVISTREEFPVEEYLDAFGQGGNDTSTTIIFNVFRGEPKALYAQLKAALSQRLVEPPSVWVMAFNSPRKKEYEAVIKYCRKKHPEVTERLTFTWSDFNFKFHGRFLLANMATTKYVLIVDDDKPIHANTVHDYIKSMKRKAGVWGNNGHLRADMLEGYKSWPKKGYNPKSSSMAEQDYLSGMWFFEQAWIEYFLKERQPSWFTSEDMHFSHVMRKYMSINTYGGTAALTARHLPQKEYAATMGSALELREFIFDHQLGRGNKVADVDAPLQTLVYAETVGDIKDFLGKLQACPSHNNSNEVVGLAGTVMSGSNGTNSDGPEVQPWCDAGKTAIVFRGAKEQDVEGLVASARQVCEWTNCTYLSAKPNITHPIQYFNMREGYGHADTGVEIPFQTSASDVMLSLVGILNNVLPRSFYLPDVSNMVWPETDRSKRNRLKIYHNTALLAVDIHRNSKTNYKWRHRDETLFDGGFASYMDTFIWKRDSFEAPTLYSE